MISAQAKTKKENPLKLRIAVAVLCFSGVLANHAAAAEQELGVKPWDDDTLLEDL